MSDVRMRDEVRGRITGIVGTKDLLEDIETLERYKKDPGNPVLIEPRRPQVVIKPESTDEVKEVVKILNEERIPIVPRSGGLDYHGNAVPTVEQAVVLDLSKMSKIIDIDPTGEEGMYAEVEPGVTFGQLQDELDKHGVRVPMPARLPQDATIISTWLNRHPTIRGSWQTYVFPSLLRNIELVRADGEVYETGGYHVGLKTVIEAVGMGLDRIPFAPLGAIGVATRGVVRIEPKPKIRKLYFAWFDEFGHLIPHVKRTMRYSATEIGETHTIMNDTCLASLLSDTKEKFDRMKDALPPWIYAICYSGPDEEWVGIQEKHLSEISSGLGFVFSPELPGAPGAGDELLEEFERPSRVGRVYEYMPHNRVEFYSRLAYIPKYDKIIRDVLSEHGYDMPIGVFILPLEQARTCYVEYDLYFNPADEKEVEKMRRMLDQVYRKLIGEGAFFTKSDYPVISEELRKKAPDYYKMMRRIVGTFDPNNVMGRVL